MHASFLPFEVQITTGNGEVLLLDWLETGSRRVEAAAIRKLRGSLFADDSRVVTGAEIDLEEHEVRSVCPGITLKELRRHSYPAAFYTHVRSAVVHEYELGAVATAWPMTSLSAGVSYANHLTGGNPYQAERKIHYHVPWLAQIARSIASGADKAYPTLPASSKPSSWWADG